MVCTWCRCTTKYYNIFFTRATLTLNWDSNGGECANFCNDKFLVQNK